MTKNNRNKKGKNGSGSMDICKESNTKNFSQATEASEGTVSKTVFAVSNRKIKKDVPMKRSKSLKKQKAVQKAISVSEKSEDKIIKSKKKMARIQSAKSLYD